MSSTVDKSPATDVPGGLTHALAVDVGGTSIKSAIVGCDGSIAYEAERPTPQNSPSGVVAEICAAIKSMEKLVGDGEVPGVYLASLTKTVGVAVPGIVDEDNGIGLYSVNLGWTDLAIGETVTAVTGRPVTLGHDVRSGALGEFTWGALAGVEPKHGFYLALGTGIYTVTIINGVALCPHAWAGEVGQAPIPDPDGEGTIITEAVCSAAALARRMHVLKPGAIPEDGGSREVFELAQQGDPVAQRIIDEGIEVLADTIAQGVYLLGPLPVVLGGGLAQAGDDFFGPLRLAVAARTPGSGAPDIIPAVLRNMSQAMGCAARCFIADGVDIKQPNPS